MLETLRGMRQRSQLHRRGAKTLLRAWRRRSQVGPWRQHAERVQWGPAMRRGAIVLMHLKHVEASAHPDMQSRLSR